MILSQEFLERIKIPSKATSIFLLYSINYDGPIPNLDLINIIRYGLHLGEVKTNRFEPSHSLALALNKAQVKYNIDFDEKSDDIKRYLRGETLTLQGNHGWTLITVDGFSLGWVKHVNHQLKNHYPKGLRNLK
jgi:NOL1/NOP2/fmu family ribosome biogenesis protein